MNYKESLQLKKGIMRRVYAIWLFRKVFNLRMILFLFFIWQVTLYVSIGEVIRNFPSFFDIASFYGFALNAFLNTEATVQLFFLFIIIVAALFLKDTIKSAVKSIFNFSIPIRIRGRFN